MTRFTIILLALSSCGAPATTSPGTMPAAPAVVAATADATPELVTYADGMQGFLWKPAGAGPFPAILYNHGSEKLPGDKEGIARFFVANGYVFFVPHRRGQGRSSGIYISDAAKRGDPADVVRLLVEQRDDVVAADHWLRGQPYVDAKEVSVMGCSYGGIETVLINELPLGFRAAVDFAGASMSWAWNEPLQVRLRQAVDRAAAPIFFLQAENDFDTTPSKALAAEAYAAGKPHKLQIFPAHGSTANEGHGGFCGAPADWGTEVLDFLHEHR